MFGAPGSDLLPPGLRELFVQQFEKDLQFFQLLFLLINKSCPIKNIDLVWTEHGPAGRLSLRHLGIKEALESSASRLLRCSKDTPHPAFCNLINDYGRHEAESCGVSDKAAGARVCKSGKPEVYRCNFGLVDIAAPVICDGHHIATLFTGQVLREKPTADGFVRIKQDVAALPYLNLHALEAAYQQVAVVTEEDIQNTTEILQAFAEYVAASWKRLAQTLTDQQWRMRERQLWSKEFAYLALDGGAGDYAGLREMVTNLGFTAYPNRALVLRLETEDESDPGRVSYDTRFMAALQAVEELCEKLENVAVAYLRKRGICVFFRDRQTPSGGSANALSGHQLASMILQAIRRRCEIRARIGAGTAKSHWRDLGESYQEACMALVGSTDAVTEYREPTAPFQALSEGIETVRVIMEQRNLDESRLAVASMPALANRQLGRELRHLAQQRSFFSSALDSMYSAAHRLGFESASVARLRGEAKAELETAFTISELQESYLRCAEFVLQELGRVYSGKKKRLVKRACEIIESHLGQTSPIDALSLTAVASAVGISASHLTRTFRQVTGETFERYVMKRRIELARYLLLDPANNISEVAEKCGFLDPGYFARVFRKITGCSPRQYCECPVRFDAKKVKYGQAAG